MSDYICPYTCSYRTNSGFCGHTGGWERCQYRQLRQPNTVVGYVPSLIKTNSDRIRTMTDEELADMLTEHGFVLEWYCGKEEIKSVVYEPKQAKNKLLDWLKQEVSTDG